jgi:catecholate siderophore receptor
VKNSFAAVLLASASPAIAAANAAVSVADIDGLEFAEAQEPIIVEGKREEYGIRSTSIATKTHTDVKSIPQALTVISEKQIEDQQLRSIADVLWFVPGATPGTGESNRDQFTLRGNNTTADMFVDGIRDDVQYFRDFYNVERIEVLRGPNAMIFGRGGGGGIVNRVTKRSSLTEIRNFALAGDSWGGARLAADLNQPIAPGVGIRLNGMYENGESFRRHVDMERWAVNPTVGLLAGPRTRIDFGYEHLHDRRTTDRGVPSLDGKPLKGHDRTFFGDPDVSFARANVDIGTIAVQHDFDAGLTVRNRTVYGDYDKFYQNVYPNGPVTDGLVRLSAYNDTTTRKNLFSQTDVIWENRIAGIDQTVLLGFEIGRQKGHNQRRSGVFSTTDTGPSSIFVPISNPTVDVPVTFLATGAHNGIEARVAAAYVQDQVRPADWLEIVAGLRFDRFSLDIHNRNTGQSFQRTDELWSPRLGIIVKPQRHLSLYASYSRSYLPQSGDQFNSLDPTSEALRPERFDNYEIGAKWEPIHGLLATAALYQLDRTNTRARSGRSGPHRAHRRAAQPRARVRPRAQHHPPLAGLRRLCVAGRGNHRDNGRRASRAQGAARSQALFLAVEPLRCVGKLGIGLGVIARTKSYASISNQCELPGFMRVDAAAFYEVASRSRASAQRRECVRHRLFPDRPQRQQYRSGRSEDGKGGDQVRLLGGELRRPFPGSLQVLDEAGALGSPAIGARHPQERARVDRHPAFGAVGKLDRRASNLLDRHGLADQRARSGGAERNGNRRPYQLALMLEPPAARLDFAGVGLAVDPPFASSDELEMLDRIGDVGLRAVDAGLLKKSVEQLPRRADERAPGEVFLIARLLADEDDLRVERPFAEHRLRAAFV